jgi:hypothetical protein
MTGKLEAVLSQSQKDSLDIEEFIFHIIEPEADDDERVIYLDSVTLQEKQRSFFLDRLRDTAEGTQYVFQQDAVTLKEKCAQLVGPRADFNLLSRQITADFAGRHKGQMSAGVFVVAIVRYQATARSQKKLILLIKMDKSPSFSYSHKQVNGKRVAEMREVPNALSETKKAIQKSAVIDVGGEFAWNVLAQDRVHKPLLGNYFQAFLGVIERQQDSALTRAALNTVRKWARTLSIDQMPEGEDSNTFTGRAFNYLKDHDQFDTSAFLDVVVRDTNKQRKQVLTDSLSEALAESGVRGQVFQPRPESLPKKERTTTYKTAEGVTVSFEGDRDAAGVSVVEVDGATILSVRTAKLIPA